MNTTTITGGPGCLIFVELTFLSSRRKARLQLISMYGLLWIDIWTCLLEVWLLNILLGPLLDLVQFGVADVPLHPLPF